MAGCLPWDNVCCAVGPGPLAGGAEPKRGAKMGRSCGRRAQLEAERRCAHLGELLLLCGFCFDFVVYRRIYPIYVLFLTAAFLNFGR